MWIDITRPIEPGALLHPEDPLPQFSRYSDMADGADYNLTQITLSLHTGTHFDAPLHFVSDGKPIMTTFILGVIQFRPWVERGLFLRAGMGIGIAGAMRTLAAESRVRRRHKAEEAARKAPIKMVPVLIGCIFPALMIVVLGPAVMMAGEIFKVSS